MTVKPVALITGGSRGIGYATMKEFSCHGWATAICARNILTTQIYPNDCLPIQHNILEDPYDLIEKVIGHYDRLDALINNAGMPMMQSIEKTSWDSLYFLIETNLVSHMLITATALPYLKMQPHAWIINILSSAAKHGFPNMTAYVASKHGLLGFTRSLAVELKGTNVKVIGVCPARVDTMMHRAAHPEAYRHWLIKRTILKPETVARRIVDAVTNDNVKNGAIIDVDPYHTNLYHKIMGRLSA
jgi:NAD(P)-dependent dehydrogenase (short-subunit alcohol dehydrogenase family)